MNVKLKALIAVAFVTMAASSAANAITAGDLVLVAFDKGSKNTFIQDLGPSLTVSTFNGASSLLSPVNLGGANWNSFSTAATFNATNVTYSVLGFSVGATVKSSVMETTNNGTPTGLTSGQFSNLNSSVANTGGALNDWFSSTTLGNGGVTSGKSSFIANTTQSLGSGDQIGSTWETLASTFNTTGILGQDNGFYIVTDDPASGRGTTSNPVIVSSLLGNWNLGASGTLNYTAATVAAVPETNTWAMAMLGLGFMGFVARRRNV